MQSSLYDLFASPSVGADTGFLSHFLHGMIGFDHLLAGVLIATLSVMRYRHEFWLPSATYLVALGIGFMIGALGVELPSNILWATAIVAGGAAMLPFWLPCPFCGAWALVATVGVTLGLAHGPDGVTSDPIQVVGGLALTLGNAVSLAPILAAAMWLSRPGNPTSQRSEIKKTASLPSVVDIELERAREKSRARRAG
ncbi:MAG: HupE/UreJ family protein [Gammaproteobacteria bacterium]